MKRATARLAGFTAGYLGVVLLGRVLDELERRDAADRDAADRLAAFLAGARADQEQQLREQRTARARQCNCTTCERTGAPILLLVQ